MMRGHITLTAAAPGVGKSTLAVEEAISLVTGEDFLNLDITEKRKVGLINNEETRDEIERRIEATCQAFKIQFTDIADRLFIHSGVDDEKFVISRDVGGEIVHTPHKQMLREFVGDLDLDVVIVVLLRKSGEHLLKQEVFYGARNQVYDGVQARGGAPSAE